MTKHGYSKPKRFGKIEIKKDIDGESTVYLRRWYLWRLESGRSIRLHHILFPDQDPDPHDHPWWFFSIVLWGGYVERWLRRGHGMTLRIGDEDVNVWDLADRGGIQITDPMFQREVDNAFRHGHFRRIRRLSFHRATDVHQITSLSRRRGAWTLFITGPEVQKWGFQTPTGHVRWEDYDPDNYVTDRGALPGAS